MDLLSSNVFSTFKDHIWKELGSLNPNWFEEISMKDSSGDETGSVQDNLSMVNHVGSFKTPFEKSLTESQFSTPKIFRHKRVSSPDTEDEASFCSDQGTETATWVPTASLSLFGMSKGGVQVTKSYEGIESRERLELFDTPKHSISQHICESLGAEINPDVSWTSSLNTPPAVQPTLILTKTEDNNCPVSPITDKNVIIVRKLFPSLSNTPGVSDPYPEKSDDPTTQQAVSFLHPSHSRKPLDPLQSALDQNDTSWRQTITDHKKGSKDNTEDIAVTHWSPLRSSNISQCDLETSCNVYDPSQHLESNLKRDQPTCEGQKLGVKQSEKASDEVQHHQVNEKIGNRGNDTSQQGNVAERTLVSSLPAEGQDLDMSELCKAFAQDLTQISDMSTSEEHTSEGIFSPSVCLSAMRQRNKELLNKQKSFQRLTNLQMDCHGIGNKGHVTAPQPKSSNRESTVKRCQSIVDAVDVTHITSSSLVLGTEKDTESKSLSDCKTEFSKVTLLQTSTKEKGTTHLNDMEENVADTYLFNSIAKESQMLSSGERSEPNLENTTISPHSPIRAKVVDGKRKEQNSRINIGDPQQIMGPPSPCLSGFKTASNRGIKISSVSIDKAKCLLQESEGESSSSVQQAKRSRNIEDTDMTHETADGILTNLTDSRSSKECDDIQCTLTASQKAHVTELCSLFEEAGSQFEFTQFKPEKLKLYFPGDMRHPQGVDKELDLDFLTGVDFDDSFSTEAGKHLAEMMTSDNMTLCPQNNKTTTAPTCISKSADPSLCSALKKEKTSTENVPTSESTDGVELTELTNDIFMSELPETYQPEDKITCISGNGFKTAGGNILRVSEKCLNKARVLFADLEECPVTISEKEVKTALDEQRLKSKHQQTADSNVADHNPNPGERVLMGFSEVRDSYCFKKRQVPSIQEDEQTDKMNENRKTDITTSYEQKCGFQLASGKKITIPVNALQEASDFFKDCDVESGDCISPNHRKPVLLVPGSGSGKSNNPSFKNAQGIQMKFGGDINGCTKPENVDDMPAPGHVKIRPQPDEQSDGGGFENPLATPDPGSVLGDTSFTEEPLSVASCTTSENPDSSVIGHLRNNSGFCTASGKKVSVSDNALKKAKCLMKECDEFTDNNILGESLFASPAQAPPQQNGGFQTASGKRVEISATALQKGKALLSDKELDCDFLTGIDFEEDVSSDGEKCPAKMKSSDKMSVPPQNKKCKVLTNVSKSAGTSLRSAMKKENASAGDVCSISKLASESITGVQSSEPSDSSATNRHPETHNKPEDKNEFIPGIGFKTAGGKALSVSENYVTKASSLFSDLEDCPVSFPDKAAKTSPEKQRVVSQLSSNRGFSTANGKKVSVSDDALKKARTLFKECDSFEDNQQKKESLGLSHPATPKLCPPQQNGGFKTASGKGVAISVAALQKAKALFSECDVVEDNKGATTHPNFPFQHTSPVACSAETPEKASVCLDISTEIPAAAEVKDTIYMDPEPGDAQNSKERINCTFQTAKGTKVHVSERNLLKAKKLLNELPDGEFANSPPTLRPYQASSFDINKFDLAQVKTPETLNLNSDLKSIDGEKPPILESGPQDMKTSLPCLPKTGCTRDGEKSLVSLDLNSSHPVIANISGNSLSENVPKEAFDVKKGSVKLSREKDLQECPAKKKPVSVSASLTCNQLTPVGGGGLQDDGMTPTSSCGMHQFSRTDKSSMLSFGSFDLGGFTVTQQQYFAQEAMDCTKALLEDDNLDDYSIAVGSDRMPTQSNADFDKGSVETEERAGKRRVGDDDVTDQPPLKRQLLADSERTADSRRHSKLLPVKSCAQGVMGDRRVFKYKIPLPPNITSPYSNKMTDVESRLQKTDLPLATPHLFPGKERTSNSKMSVFVPPSHKNAQRVTPKISTPQDKGRKSVVFVPPFKKQKTIDPVSSPSPLAKKDCLPHLFATSNKTHKYVPPTMKTKSPAQIIDGKREEHIQASTSWNTEQTKSDVKSGPNCSFHPGTEDFDAKKSDPEPGLLGSQDISQDLQNLQFAWDMQDMRIQKKRHQTIRPLPGSFFLAKTSGVKRIPLRDAVNKQPPAKHTQKQLYKYGVHQYVCDINREKAESFRLKFHQFFNQEVLTDRGGVHLADGGWLIPRNDGTMGKEEFYKALCDTPGVDPKLISQEWVYNHYSWIVWKQASMERCFPATLGGLCLTPEQILLQLKYRYDVEVDHSCRPALRKIMERDDTAAKTIVLCVCGVVSWGQNPTGQTPRAIDTKVEFQVGIIMLTDGWYSIKAQLDVPLTAMLHKGRLAIGGKVIIHGAELEGSQNACSPLEAPEALMLKICANSTRPARWDTKLGFHRDPHPFLLPLSSLYTTGGPVGCVDIVILRSYPMQWMEKKPDGGFVFRCTRAEEREARRYNDNKQRAMELLFAKIQADFEKEEKVTNKPRGKRRTLSHQDIKSLQEGEELHQAVENDPVYVEAQLSEQQLEALHTYTRTLVEKNQAELQERYRSALENAQKDQGSCLERIVTPVWRLSIVDSRDQLNSKVYILNIWRPSADLQSLLKEGGRYRVYKLTASEGKKVTGTAALQLTATKKTQFRDIQTTSEWLSLHFQPRKSINFLNLQNPEFHPACGEVDLVGYVISIIDGQGSSPAFYLVDGDLNFVKVRCFSPLVQSGLEDLIKPFALLALSNLQLRAHSSSIAVLYAGDRVLISSNPKDVHLQESLTQLRNLVQGQVNFFKRAEEKLLNFSQSDRLSSTSSSALQPKTPICRNDGGHNVKTSVPSQQSFSCGSVTPMNRSTPPANSPVDKDQKSLKRRRALDYLSRIPSPPPLSPLATVHSPCLNKTFNPPRRSCTPSTLKTVQTPACKTLDSSVDQWVNDEELAMIDTQALHGENGGLGIQ